MAARKNPVGHPRTVNKDLPAGETRSGNPPRVRISAGAQRDQYQYRVAAERKAGRKFDTNTIVNHVDPNTKADRNPKTTVISRSENSRMDGGLRKNAQGKMVPSKGKAKK